MTAIVPIWDHGSISRIPIESSSNGGSSLSLTNDLNHINNGQVPLAMFLLALNEYLRLTKLTTAIR
jgi:hypothetical protein